MASVIYLCEGCGDRLQPSDEVRAVYRELADVIGGEEIVKPRWAYTHLGHEPHGRAYRIIGRGLLSDLERERHNKDAWIAAWHAQAAQEGIERDAAYWQAAWEWIAAQRKHRVRP